ncbi:MAG: sodium/glutamate symporter [Bacillus sp. (in: firmicutes)]
MSLEVAGFAAIVLAALLITGKWVRIKAAFLQKLFLPTSLIGGFTALILGPEILGRAVGPPLDNGLFTEEIVQVWAELPGLLINVVFACLFIGLALPKPRKMLKVGGPHLALGYTLSFSQYVLGILLAITLLTPVFGLSPAAGSLIEISFVGGHGTAAGMQGTFNEFDFEEGYDLAIGLATVSLLSGIIVGMILINWGARNGISKTLKNPNDISVEQMSGIIDESKRESAGSKTTSTMSIEPLALHAGFVSIAILTGYILLEFFVWLENITYGQATGIYLFRYVPLFPFAMIGGIFVQLALSKSKYQLVDRGLIDRIQGVALDFLVIASIASLSLQVIGDNLVPFLLLAVTGVLLNVALFLYLAPRMIPDYWFERGLGDFGQATGVAATGIMLIRIVDPEGKSPALNAFGYKQILFEPMVGGGLITAASVPLIIQFGSIPVLIGAIVLTGISLYIGIYHFGRKQKGLTSKDGYSSNG